MDVKRDSFRWLIIKAEGLGARSGVVSTSEPGRRPPRRFYKLFSPGHVGMTAQCGAKN